VTEYRRKRKRAGRSYSRKRPYSPKLGGGGYSGPRNYSRPHDFRYEREPSSKPPKTETHYEIIERPSTESYRLPAYRPEPDQASMEKTVSRAIEKYLRDEPEQKEAETRPELETPPNLLEVGLEANRLGETSPAVEEKAPEIELTEPAEPLAEMSQETNPLADIGPELYDIPIADLELLLVELDANPLEVRPERNIEAEPVREQ